MKHFMGWVVKGFAYLGMIGLLTNINGCATIMQGGSNKVSFDSKPRGASVYLDGKIQGVTPLVVMVPNSSDGIVTISLDGYQTKTIELSKTFSGWMVGDILGAGAPIFPIAVAVDLITNNQGHYPESTHYADLAVVIK